MFLFWLIEKSSFFWSFGGGVGVEVAVVVQ